MRLGSFIGAFVLAEALAAAAVMAAPVAAPVGNYACLKHFMRAFFSKLRLPQKTWLAWRTIA